MGCLLAGVLLVSAPGALAAGPVDTSWWMGGWWADAWQAVVSVFAASSEENSTEPEPEPAPAPAPKAPQDEGGTTTDCATCGGGGEKDSLPGLDPNG